MAFGIGLASQCAVENKPIVVDAVPANYLAIKSFLGRGYLGILVRQCRVCQGRCRDPLVVMGAWSVGAAAVHDGLGSLAAGFAVTFAAQVGACGTGSYISTVARVS